MATPTPWLQVEAVFKEIYTRQGHGIQNVQMVQNVTTTNIELRYYQNQQLMVQALDFQAIQAAAASQNLQGLANLYMGYAVLEGRRHDQPYTELDAAWQEALVEDVRWKKFHKAWVGAKAENLLRTHLVRLGELRSWLKGGVFHMKGSSGTWYRIYARESDLYAKVFRRKGQTSNYEFYCANTSSYAGHTFIHAYDDAVAKILLLEACEEAFLATALPDGNMRRNVVAKLTTKEALRIQAETCKT